MKLITTVPCREFGFQPNLALGSSCNLLRASPKMHQELFELCHVCAFSGLITQTKCFLLITHNYNLVPNLGANDWCRGCALNSTITFPPSLD